MWFRAPIARLLSLGTLMLAAVGGCRDDDQPLIVAPAPSAAIVPVNGYVVTSLLDPGDSFCTPVGTGDGCTLREALTIADPGDTIVFDVTGTIVLQFQELLINKNLTILGPGAGNLTISGNDSKRAFSIATGQTVFISGLTITDAYGSFGGGITNAGTLSLSRITITNSSASTGGGVANSGILTVDSSTIYGNRAFFGGGLGTEGGRMTVRHSTIAFDTSTYEGGGINTEYGNLVLIQSTVANNVAAYGGGVSTETASANAPGSDSTVIVNSTISGNKAINTEFGGGGIKNWNGRLRITHSTITGNTTAYAGGGVASWNDLFTRTYVKGTIIWGNSRITGAAPVADDVAAVETGNRYSSLGNNLIGAAGLNVDFTQEFNAIGDQTAVADAKLGALASNGGETQTHALLAGSPAIDLGTCADHAGNTVAVDQRDVARPQGGNCDIGAFELQSSGTTPTFTFDLSGLPAKTYGDASFSVASYVTTNSTGAVTFGLGTGSVGCSVVMDTVTIIGAATGTDFCIVTATLAAAAPYSGAGPISSSFQIGKASLTVTADDETITYGGTPAFSVQHSGFVGTDDATSLGGTLTYTFEGTGSTSYGPSTVTPVNAGTYSITPGGYTSANYSFAYVPGTFTIGKAASAVSINNLPSSGVVGGSFTPAYTTTGDGTPSVTSLSPAICSVASGVVHYDAAGTCVLQASISETQNYAPATGSQQSFTITSAPLEFTSSCSYTVNTRTGQRLVQVSWSNAVPGVTQILVTSGARTSTRQLAPTASGSWTTRFQSGTPTYELRGGSVRRDFGTSLEPAGTACTLQ